MPINKTRAYVTSDGATHATINEAKTRELGIALNPTGGEISPTLAATIDLLVADCDRIVSILKVREPKKRTVKPKVKPAATPKPKAA